MTPQKAPNKMKVCFLINKLAIGGSERKIVRVANQMSDRGLDVTLCCMKNDSDSFLKSTLNSSVNLVELTGNANLLKYFVFSRFNTVFLLNSFPALFAPWIRLNNLTSKIVYLNNTSILPDSYSTFKLGLLKFSARFISLIVYGAENQKKTWFDKYNFHRFNSLVIYNGVDLSLFKKRVNVNNDKLQIVMVGQLRKEKNHIEALNVLKTLKDNGINYHLSIVGGDKGDGAKDKLQKIVNHLGLLNNVTFHGEIKNVTDILNTADVFLLCSNAVETFSNAVLEAMSMSLSVVISDVGGAKEMVNSGVDGYVYSSGDEKALYDILLRMQDKDLRENISSHARLKVEREFSSDIMMENYIKLVKGVH